MQLTQYDGFVFSDLTMTGDLPADQGTGWQINQRITPRGADFAVLGTASIQPRSIDVEFVYTGSRTDYWQLFDELAGKLNPLDQSDRRKLYATRPDGTLVWRYARISVPSGWPDEEVNGVTVRFLSTDPRWFKVTPKTITAVPGSTAGGFNTLGFNTSAIAVPNAGQAVVHPTILFSSFDVATTGAWTYRRRQTITNNLTRTVQNLVVMVSMGDTTGLVLAGKALVGGGDVRVIAPDGTQVPRDLVAWNSALTWVYFYVASMEPGETQNFDIVYGNGFAGSPPTLTYPYQPAFLTDSYVQTVSFAAADAARLWVEVTGDIFAGRDNKFRDGALYFATGANAGVGKKISSHTYNTPTAGRTRINFTSAFANAIALTDDFNIISSRNGVWMYDVDSTVNRGTDKARGRWYASSGESVPAVVDYSVPGSWAPYLYYDGKDKKGQSRFKRIVPTAGGDEDTYTILYAQRTWEGGGRVNEEGVADGVSISLPFPITDYQWNGQTVDDINMVKFLIGGRGSGGNDWHELDSISGGTAWAPSITFPGTEILQLYHGVIPLDGEDEVDQTWKQDGGSSSAVGSTTTIVDSTKNWRTNQWASAFLTFTAGARSGLVREIVSNTATVLTFTPAIGGNTKVDQQYEVRQITQVARIVDGNRCTITFDMAGLVMPALGAETGCNDFSTRMWIGGGKDSSAVLAGQRRAAVELGKSPESFLMTANGSEAMQINSASRTINITNYAGTTILQRLTDPRVRWRYTDDLGQEQQSVNGMPLPIGINKLVNPGAETNASGWTRGTNGTITATGPTQDATFYASQGGGTKSFKLTISASTAGSFVEAIADDRIPVLPGELVSIAGYVYITNALIVPLLGIAFYTAGGSLISRDMQINFTQPINNWLAEGHAAIAPATAASYSVVVRGNIPSGTPTGSLYFDDMSAGSPVLFFQNDHSGPGGITITFSEAYLL